MLEYINIILFFVIIIILFIYMFAIISLRQAFGSNTSVFRLLIPAFISLFIMCINIFLLIYFFKDKQYISTIVNFITILILCLPCLINFS